MTRLFILTIVILTSCVTIHNKKDFTYLTNTNATSLDLLNLNGYYFCEDSIYQYYNYQTTNLLSSPYKPGITGKYQDSMKTNVISAIILYKTGHAYICDITFSGIQITEKDDKITGENTLAASKKDFQDFIKMIDTKNYKKNRFGISYWGAYRFENDKINIQYFENRTGNYDLIELQGLIIDKTKFRLIKRVNRSNHTDKKQINDLYGFESHHFKPDSTNNYIEKLIQRIQKVQV